MQKKTIRELFNGARNSTLNEQEMSLYKQAIKMASQNISSATRDVIRNLYHSLRWRKESVSPVCESTRGIQSIWESMKNNLAEAKIPDPTEKLTNEEELTMHIDIKVNNKELVELNSKTLLKMELLSGAMQALGKLISSYKCSYSDEDVLTVTGIGQLVSLLGDKHLYDWSQLYDDHLKLVKSD